MTTIHPTSSAAPPPWRAETALADAVASAVRALWQCELPVPAASTLEIPDDSVMGDLACTAAMKLAKPLRRPPLEIAKALEQALQPALSHPPLHGAIARMAVRPPGFLNFFFATPALAALLSDIRRDGARFGASTLGAGQRISVEFVSANPTGSLSIAHGRQAAVGDVLARVLRHAGYDVCREYLLNDEGVQMDLLGHSIYARYRELAGQPMPIPENGYQGAYIIDLARALRERDGDRWMSVPLEEVIPTFRDFGIAALLDVIKEDLRQFDVTFDRWTSQQAINREGRIDRAVEALRQAGHVYEADGAVWFKSTAFGDEKDRVLRKQGGAWTYFAPDIAYHQDKFERGFHRLVDLWGPDHHGYIPRLKAAVQALTGRDELTVLIVQLVTLYRRGVPVPMSTRQGQFVTLRELIQEVGKDAARFFFLTRRIESHLDFDLELAKAQTLDNPVYYIQYAHARICSVLKFRDERGAAPAAASDAGRLQAPEELELLRNLRQFPLVIELCARQLDPYNLTWYLRRLAAGFHAFYAKHRVVGDDAALSAARADLADAVRSVLAIGLDLLGVSAPRAMTRAADDTADRAA